MNQLIKLDPGFVTGFTDAEGCFLLNIYRDPKLKVGWRVLPSFQIGLHQKDQALLEQIQSFFGVGHIHKHGSLSLLFRIESVKDLAVIRKHLEKFPLITQKRADYELFKQAFLLIEKKEHLTSDGLCKILALKASMNLGLSSGLKAAFGDITPMDRPLVKNQTIEDPN